MKKIIILATLLTSCVTMDKLRTEDCRDVINNSPIVALGSEAGLTELGLVLMCVETRKAKCCLLFAEFSVHNVVGADGMCYLGDSKYQYKTTCMEEIK